MAALPGLARAAAAPFRGPTDLLRSMAPILRREFVAILRTRKAYWISVVTVALASLVPILSWPEEESTTPFQGAFLAFTFYHQAFQYLFFIFVPLVTATAVTAERERGTWEPLYNTLIRPSGIVLGKTLAGTLFFLLLAAFTAPMVCLLLLLGGLGAEDLFWPFLGLVVAIIYYGAIGLWASMRHDRTGPAILTAYLAIVLLGVVKTVALMPVIMLVGFAGGGPLMWWQRLPLAADALIALILLFWVIRRARFPDRPVSRRRERARARAARAAEAAGKAPKRRRPARTWLTALLLRPCERGIPDAWNPVLVASLRSDALGQARFRRGLFWTLVVLALVLVVPGFFFDLGGSFAIFAHVVMVTVPVLLLPGVAASLIASDRELDRMDLLRSTLLTPFRIVWGKLIAALAGSSGLVVVGVAACSAAVFTLDERSWGPFRRSDLLESPLEYLLYLVTTLVVVVVVAISSGLLASSIARRTTPALLLAYTLAIGFLWIGPLIVAEIVEAADLDGSVPTALSPFIEFFKMLQGSSGPGEWATAALIALAIAALEIVLAVAALRRRDFREPRPTAP